MNLIKGLGLFFLIFLLACNKGPKLIESSASSSNGENNTGIFTGSPSIQTESSKTEATGFSQNLHQVKVLEVLPTDKYVYLRVEEEGEDDESDFENYDTSEKDKYKPNRTSPEDELKVHTDGEINTGEKQNKHNENEQS